MLKPTPVIVLWQAGGRPRRKKFVLSGICWQNNELFKTKKDHEEMLKRGEEAALLSEQLENAFEQNKELSRQDRQKLESLEKIVHKIRKELGGDDDGEEDAALGSGAKPSTPREAFNILKAATLKLVGELKKTSRFSISVMAIQSSNSVLRLVKFLRLRS